MIILESTGHGTNGSNGNGNGNGQKRGTTRDQRGAIYKTRPPTADTKEGTSGKKVKLSANYFKLIRKPNFEFSLYRVDFEPEVDVNHLRKAFLAKQRDLLGGYLYDGQSMVYLTRRLEQEVYKLPVTSREGNEYTITIKNTGTIIQMTDAMATQVFNLILRRAMGALKMQLVGRNLYDAKSK